MYFRRADNENVGGVRLIIFAFARELFPPNKRSRERPGNAVQYTEATIDNLSKYGNGRSECPRTTRVSGGNFTTTRYVTVRLIVYEGNSV